MKPQQLWTMLFVVWLRLGQQLSHGTVWMLIAGRCPTDIKYDVAFDGEGKLKAVRIHGILSAGAVEDLASQDGLLLKQGACQVVPCPRSPPLCK